MKQSFKDLEDWQLLAIRETVLLEFMIASLTGLRSCEKRWQTKPSVIAARAFKDGQAATDCYMREIERARDKLTAEEESRESKINGSE